MRSETPIYVDGFDQLFFVLTKSTYPTFRILFNPYLFLIYPKCHDNLPLFTHLPLHTSILFLNLYPSTLKCTHNISSLTIIYSKYAQLRNTTNVLAVKHSKYTKICSHQPYFTRNICFFAANLIRSYAHLFIYIEHYHAQPYYLFTFSLLQREIINIFLIYSIYMAAMFIYTIFLPLPQSPTGKTNRVHDQTLSSTSVSPLQGITSNDMHV